MNRSMTTSIVTVALLSCALVLAVSAQTQPTPQATPKEAPQAQMPVDHRQMMQQKMKDMGMSDAMIMQCRMMSAVEVSAYDPAATLALGSELQLTADQVQKLQAIEKDSRQQVEALLTETQKQSLLAIQTPTTMTKMCQEMTMTPCMQQAMKDKGQPCQMCPMHAMMCPSAPETPAASPAAEPPKDEATPLQQTSPVTR